MNNRHPLALVPFALLLGSPALAEVLQQEMPSKFLSWQNIKQSSGKVDYQCRATGDAKFQKAARCEKAGAVQPHMLRHACGFAHADQGSDTRLIQDYLGHRNIQHTVRYTATNPARFEKLWR